MYWLMVGDPYNGIKKATMDGENATLIIPIIGSFFPFALTIDIEEKRLYYATFDRFVDSFTTANLMPLTYIPMI